MGDAKIVQALQSVSIHLDGAPFAVHKGDRFYADDRVVQGREALFGEVTVRRSQPAPSTRAAVETTDATPGSRRAVTAPPAEPVVAPSTAPARAGRGTSKGGKADA